MERVKKRWSEWFSYEIISTCFLFIQLKDAIGINIHYITIITSASEFEVLHVHHLILDHNSVL